MVTLGVAHICITFPPHVHGHSFIHMDVFVCVMIILILVLLCSLHLLLQWRPSLRMTQQSLASLLLSLVTRLEWLTLYVKLINQDQVSSSFFLDDCSLHKKFLLDVPCILSWLLVVLSGWLFSFFWVIFLWPKLTMLTKVFSSKLFYQTRQLSVHESIFHQHLQLPSVMSQSFSIPLNTCFYLRTL